MKKSIIAIRRNGTLISCNRCDWLSTRGTRIKDAVEHARVHKGERPA